MHNLIGRPILTTASSPASSIERSANAAPVTFVAKSAPADPAPATTAPTCSTCEAILPALVRVEDLLQSLLLDVSELKTRIDQATGVYADRPV